MKWLEISVEADGEAAEAVAELFNRYGRGGAVLETRVDAFEHELESAPPPARVVVKTYLPLDDAGRELQQRIETGLWHLSQVTPLPEPAFRELAETDWAEAWKQHYHPVRAGRRLVIVPAWEAYTPAPGEAVVRLEPGMAFGTGLHPTTRLCLAALEDLLTPGATVLDVGTGSGVLAIAAARLGAGPVLALDADPVAVDVARENTRLNRVDGRVTIRHGSLPGGDDVPLHFRPDGRLDLLSAGTFDLVVANILAPVIASMAPALAARVASGGHVVVSGLIDTQEAEVAAALEGPGLRMAGRSQEKDWICLVAAHHRVCDA